MTDYVYPAVVLDVHDGDTVKVAVRLRRMRTKLPGDLGFHMYIEGGWLTLHAPMRLIGINSPELRTPEGVVARDYLLTLIAVGDLIQVRSFVPTHRIDPDKYGDRWDAVLVRKDGMIINDQMVASGNAKPWTGLGPKPV